MSAAVEPRPSSGPRVNWFVLVVGLGVTALLVVFLAGGFGIDPHRLETEVLDGKPAAPFSLVDLEGKTWTLEELRGKPVVLNFWSTWCGPCKMEHPVLLQAPKRYPDVVFLGIVYHDDVDAVRRYLAMKGTAYPHLVDPKGRVAIDYGVTGVPETLFIDRNGLIVHKEAAPVDPPTLDQLVARIRP